MFTPPPSPAPFRANRSVSPTRSVSEADEALLLPPCHSYGNSLRTSTASSDTADARHHSKFRAARRIRWTIVLVPILLIVITLSTRYFSHPSVLDLLSGRRGSNMGPALGWRIHKRHADPGPVPLTSGDSASDALLTSSAASSALAAPTSATPTTPQSVPTIPSSPPALPTPFPQPLDMSLSSNFTTQGCLNFFANMTTSTAFRTCRPFSLLLQTSAAFIQAQENVTALNNIIWGTCNTNLDASQCNENMAWFADSLKIECDDDMKEDNAIVLQTLKGLEAYTLLRNTGCLADQATGAYCYVEAAHSSQPADLYFYSLPLGTALPPSITPSCSACTKSVMALYAQQVSNLTGLSDVYNGAATVANHACGQGYAQITSVNGAPSTFGGARTWQLLWALGVAGTLLSW